ncbi:MAG: DUF2935 domain-containing protein [Clostridiaceae bacterium]
MISSSTFVSRSLELHLFFARIMKEHSFFLEAGFTSRDTNFINQADAFRKNFDFLLAEVIKISNGLISPTVLNSGEILTPYTLKAEMASAYLTGVKIPTCITQIESGLTGGNVNFVPPMIEQQVYIINEKAINLIRGIIEFKEIILSKVLSCEMFTVNYPLLIDHILREAKLYLQMVQSLQAKDDMDINKEAYEQELFWNRIMAEHSKFIRGFLDPTEEDLFNIANNFGKEFDNLLSEAKQSMSKTIDLKEYTDESLDATKRIRDFKLQGTQGILQCKIKSIIIPLLGDHVLREANHFLRLLNTYESNL